MIFKSERALNHLLKKGFVYTLIPQKRTLTRKYDWITNKRGGRKLADVVVKYVGEVEVRTYGSVVHHVNGYTVFLEEYAKYSGFYFEDDWLNALRKINGKLPERLFLYKVELVDGS